MTTLPRTFFALTGLVALLGAGCAGSTSPGGDGNMTTDSSSDTAPDVPVATSCSTAGCEAGMLCVRTLFQGGAQRFPDDAGNCPPGTMLSGNSCVGSPSFRCVPRPAGCSPLACSCASSICTSGYQCATPSNDEVDCTLLAP